MKKLLLISCCFISLSQSMQNMSKKEDRVKEPINLVLSLDHVLLHDASKTMEPVHTFFADKSFLVEDLDGAYHIVPAFLAPFLRYVTQNYTVAFFDDVGERYKNTETVVKNIWTRVFGINKPNTLRTLSRDDLTFIKTEEPGISCKKNITRIGQLHNTVLVDAYLSWSMKGQESNMLLVPSYNFSTLYRSIKFYSDKDKDSYKQAIKDFITNKIALDDFLSFYKLLYVVGVLDIACKHTTNIIEGLRAIQCEDNRSKVYDRQSDLTYYKRGYRILLSYTDDLEKHVEIMYLLKDADAMWSVLPQEIREEIVKYMVAFAQREMQIFPEIEQYFYS
jgi:hypothetical protein